MVLYRFRRTTEKSIAEMKTGSRSKLVPTLSTVEVEYSEVDEASALLQCTETAQRTKLFPERWYILFMFTFLTTQQTLFWFTFSSVPSTVLLYYPALTNDAVLQLLNWGPIIFIPLLPVFTWILTWKNGLSLSLRACAWLCFGGCLIRCIPCVMSSDARNTSAAMLFLHAGQILNAAAGPIVMASPSRVSAVWFSPEWRTRATAIAYIGGNIGSAVGFLFGPYITNGDADNVPRLLYVELCIAVIPVIFLTIYSPDHPPLAPSMAVYNNDKTVGIAEFWRVSEVIFSIPGMMFLIGVAGFQAGSAAGWSGLLPDIIGPPLFDENFAGWVGCVNSAAGTAGVFFVGVVADYYFQRNLKALLVWMFLFATVSSVWLALVLPSPFVGNGTVLATSNATVIGSAGVVGFFQGACEPLFYEIAAELSYPLPEGTSAGSQL